jgi:hypothetical protein
MAGADKTEFRKVRSVHAQYANFVTDSTVEALCASISPKMGCMSSGSYRWSGLRVVFALLALCAITTQLVVHVGLGFDVVNFFSYYTNLGNLLAAVTLVVAVAGSGVGEGRARVETLRLIAVVNMTLIGLVSAVLLRNVDLGALLPWVNWSLHYVMPVFMIVDWIACPPRVRLRRSALLISLSFPLAYLGYTLMRGSAISWYPYPFLRPEESGGASGVALRVIVITLAYVVVGSALLALGNTRSRPELS